MKVLLDTCTLSELRKPNGNFLVKEALNKFSSKDIYLSVITLGEIVKGVELLVESERKRELRRWLLNVQECYSESILGVDLETVHLWGSLTATAQKTGKIISASDGLIAATAIKYGLYVMTRNTSDFVSTGAKILNPWTEESL